MKKLLLVVLMLCCAGAFAQQNQAARVKALSHVPASLLKMKASASHIRKNVDNGGPLNRHSATTPVAGGSRSNAAETTIGNTYYDLQTNNTISNRFVNNADGTMSAVWTYSPDGTAGYPNRGSGYNYFDGSSWQAEPTARIESERAGFSNVGVTASGQEVVITHGIQTTGPSLGILYTSRAAKGTGAWTTNDALLGEYPTDTINFWPKMATGGSDGLSIHVIWRGGSVSNDIDGQDGPIFYSRSQNDGANFDIVQSILPLIDSSYYLGFSADNYSIDVRDSVVAIVASDYAEDVVLLKSSDNGTTWTKEIAYQYPIPFFDETTMQTDTGGGGPYVLLSPTGDANVVIDNNYLVHVFFTGVNTFDTIPGDGTVSGSGLLYYPFSSELFYWNETMPTDSITFIAYAPILIPGDTTNYFPPDDPTDCPNDPYPWGAYGGLTKVLEMPSPGVDANNNLYVVYQTTDELSDPSTVSDNNNKLFKHPYLIKSTDGGNTWTNYDSAYDVVLATQGPQNIEYEGVFASMAKRVDSQVHIIYQRDGFPGNSLAAAGTCDAEVNSVNSPSDIIYMGADTSLNMSVGIPQLPTTTYGVVISANYPNPANDFTHFNVTLNKAANVKIDVEDIFGQNLYSENKGKLSGGVHVMTLNTSYLAAGIYFYSVTVDTEKVTGKMIVEK